MKNYLLLSVTLLFNIMIAFSQESKVTVNHEGKDFYMLKHAWKAQWITHPTASTMDYGVFLFRKTFSVDTLPSQFNIYVSADNRYRLYVNGQYVTYGPSLGDIDHWRYETIDIVKYLRKGDNVIAAEVINFGEYRRAAQQTFQTAFILQADSEEPVINTGTTPWKVMKNEAYSCIPFTSDSLKTYYAAGPGESIEAGKYPWGWKELSYNDSVWLSPKLGTVEFAVGRGFLYGSTWFLVPRELPFMQETKQRFHEIVRVEGVKSVDNFIYKNDTAIIPAHTKVSILLDSKYHTTGFPELIISKGENTKIKITYAEALFLPDTLNDVSPGAHFSQIDLKGNRNEIEGKSIFGYYDIIISDGGEKRMFKPFSRKTFRYVQLDIETADEPLVIDDYYNVFTGYPYAKKATFVSDDKQLTQIFDAAWRTIRNSSEENLFDPYYEQLQYIGDARIEALTAIYVSGDDKLMRKAIKQFDDSRLPEGLTQSRYPSYIVQIIPTYSLLWVDMIHDYFMYRNDEQFVEQFVPGMESVLNWFARRIDTTGMVTGLDWWNFTDWAHGFPNGIPPGADDGYSANVNLQYVYALQNAIEIFDHFGYTYEVKKYTAIKDTIQSVVMRKCYDDTKKLIAETPDKEIFSQHTNVWAILTNTVQLDKQKQMMETVLADSSLIQGTIYFRFYIARALQKAGLADRYLDMLQPWETMLGKGMTTFGETDELPRSECHGWSASPAFDFLHTVAGIYPAQPGFLSVNIKPAMGHLNKMFVVFHHPQGDIQVSLKRSGKRRVEGYIMMPLGVTGTFLWHKKKIELKAGKNVINAR